MSEENTFDDFLGDESKEPLEHSIEGAELHLREITDTPGKIYYLENALSEYRKFWIELGMDPAKIMDSDYLREGLSDKPNVFNYPIWVKEEIEALKRKLAYEERNPPKQEHGHNSPALTNNQYVLICYYFFKYAGVEPRKVVDIAPLAKFIHVITGKQFTKIQNSDFYKRFSKAPNFKKDKQLIDDLETIKIQFERVELKEIKTMIDNDIDEARTEMKRGKAEK